MADSETRQYLPEVQAYITALDEATAAETATQRTLRAKYENAYRDTDYYGPEKTAQRQEHDREQGETYTARRVAQNEAWNTLGQSSDPLVRWIAENCKEYQGYAVDILKALPATLDELDEVAEDSDWCDIWDRFRGQAIEAGVMPGVKPPTPARKAVFEVINNASCCALGARATRRVSHALDALVKEASEAATETSEEVQAA